MRCKLSPPPSNDAHRHKPLAGWWTPWILFCVARHKGCQSHSLALLTCYPMCCVIWYGATAMQCCCHHQLLYSKQPAIAGLLKCRSYWWMMQQETTGLPIPSVVSLIGIDIHHLGVCFVCGSCQKHVEHNILFTGYTWVITTDITYCSIASLADNSNAIKVG